MTVEKELSALIRETLRDQDVVKILTSSPKLKRLLRRMIDELRRLSDEDEDDGSVFPVKSGAETRLLRTCDIYFFEAQGRKVALRTKAQEISFYSSFEQLQELLPLWFLRCHRGYMINTKKMRGVSFSESNIAMADGSSIPFSRMYREAVRAALHKQIGDQGGSTV